MRRPRKFLFDECVSLPTFDQLCEHFRAQQDPPELAHLMRWEWDGQWDEHWVPRIAADGWTVISSDRGRSGGLKKGQKLKVVCVNHKVTHILLSPAIHHLASQEKFETIKRAWPKIERTTKAEAGSRFGLRLDPDGTLVMKLMPVPKEQPREEPPRA